MNNMITDGDDERPFSARTLGRAAYMAYTAKAGGVSLVTGDKLPEWDALAENIQDAWMDAGDAAFWVVMNHITALRFAGRSGGRP